MNAAHIKPGMTVWRWHAADGCARPYLVIAVDGGSAFLRYTGEKAAPHSAAFNNPDSFWNCLLHATEGEAIAAQVVEMRKSADFHHRAAVDADQHAEKLYRKAVKAGYRGVKP